MTIILNGTTGVTFPNGVTMSDGTSAPVTVAQGGTGANTASAARTSLGTNDAANITTGTLAVARGGTGTNATTFCNLTSNVAGTLPVANGGTGATTLTANNVLLGNGTSALQAVAPGSNGNVLTSNGTTWVSSAPSGGVTSLNGQTGAITNTSIYAIGSYLWVAGVTDAQAQLDVTPNSTYSGSNFTLSTTRLFNDNYGNFIGRAVNGGIAGTWRCMGSGGAMWYDGNSNKVGGALFVRVS